MNLKKPIITESKIDEKPKQIILGSLLGDGGIYSIHKNGASYSETHSIKQKDYLIWKNNNCFRIFNTKIREYEQYEKTQKKYYGKINITTKSFPIFFAYRKMFYPDGKKEVSPKILDQLNKLGLAMWYCDDGNYHITGKTVRIMTDSFSYKEQQLIRLWFKESYNLDCKIVKRKRGSYYIEFNKWEGEKFLNIIKKHVPPSMRYKLGHLLEENSERIKTALKRASLRHKKYYIKNKAKILERQNKYRQKSEIKERERLKKQIYYKKNKERIVKRCKIYQEKNKEKNKKTAMEYYHKNRERIKVIDRKYYIKNRELILKKQIEYNKKPEIKKRKRKYDKECYKKKKELMLCAPLAGKKGNAQR